jgi:hypothetical protein
MGHAPVRFECVWTEMENVTAENNHSDHIDTVGSLGTCCIDIVALPQPIVHSILISGV